jgi:class 3 adenylate cyclase
MSVWEKWRPWLQREKQLLLELALMLLVALVVGVYFLEHFSARLQAEQRVQLKALAQQTALRSAESLAGDDLIGLNVIARETRALDPVGGVQFLDVAREPVTGKSDDSLPVKVEVPVALPDGELAGSVVLAAAHDTAPRQRLETGYVLVVLGLLALRAAAEVIRRRLWRPREPVAQTPPAEEGEASETRPAGPVDGDAPAPDGVSVELRLSVVNFDHFQQRYTRSALEALLADYHHLLREVAALYGGEVITAIGDRARIRFTGEPLSHTAFSALCAGLLFLRVARLQAPRRKAGQSPALEFKALVSNQFNEADSWDLCLAGVPGRLNVPEAELTRAELDVKALYQTERAQLVQAGDRQIRLQPVEQLAHRYQTLLRTQAEKVMGGSGVSGEASPSK